MPKVTWLKTKETAKPKPKVNYLSALFTAYRKEKKISSVDMAEKLGCTAQNVRVQMSKPGTEWNIGKLLAYCDVLGIPYLEALEAAAK